MGNCFFLYDEDNIIPNLLPTAHGTDRNYLTVEYGSFARAAASDNEWLIPIFNDFLSSIDNTYGKNDICGSLFRKIEDQINKSDDNKTDECTWTFLELLTRNTAEEYIAKTSSKSKKDKEYIYVAIFDRSLRGILNDITEKGSTNIKRFSDYFKEFWKTKKIKAMDTSLTIHDDIMAVNYYPNNIHDLIALDLNKVMTQSVHMMKECEYCKMLFVPTRASDKYCHMPGRKGEKDCGAYMNKPQGDFAILRNKARDLQHKTLAILMTKGLDPIKAKEKYKEWSKNCAEQMSKFEAASDIEGFKQWIEDTKFYKQKDLL